MKKIILVFILICNMIFPNKTITLATDPFPPFHSPDVKGYGFFAEIVGAAFKEGGYDLKIEFVPWNRAVENAATGYYDGVIGVLYSKERAEKFIFSNSVYKITAGMYARADFDLTLNEIKKSKKLKMGKVRGYYYSEEVNALKNFTMVENSNVETNLTALINKRVDLIVETNVVIENLLNNSFLKNKNDVKLVEELNKEDYKIMVSKKNPNSYEIIKKFNDGLKTIKDNGIYDKILKKYKMKTPN